MDFKNKDIIITEYSYKLKLLEELSKSSGFLDVKIMTKKEFLENYLFSYDEEAIYYLINKYNISLDLANTYLNSLYYIFDKDYKNDKLNDLVKIKKELIDNNLLIFNKAFKKSLKNKRVVFYKNNYLNKLDKEIIKDLEDVLIIDKDYDKNIPKVYEFSSIFEEVEFVCISILKLIEEGISPSDIKISNIDDEYTNIINFIFGFYNIKTSINNNYLISNTIAKEFLDYSGSLEDKISFIKKYDNDIVNQIVNICNKYVLFDDIDIVMNMITNDFKNTTIKKEKYDNEIEIIDYKNYDCENKHVFLMSFNSSSIPVTYKDEDYIPDSQKENTLFETTIEKNKKEKEITINNILNIKNLVITYKLTSAFETYYPSILIDDLNFEVIKDFKYDEIYSKEYSSLMLSKEIDNYVNYNVKSDKLINYISSLNPLYNTYSNKYTKINNKELLNYLKDGISLSYSSLDNYYKCSFKYYIKHILKLDTFEDSFDTFIGKLFHYVIENGLLNDKDASVLINEYLKDKELSKKEKVFINNLKEDIEFMLSTLRDNLKYTNLKDVIFEQNIKVCKNDKIKVTFTGFIDAMMYRKYSDKTISVIIDYKTGNASSDLAYLPYGLSMQLPIYLYLAKNSEIKDITFGGFYLQKVLPEKHKIDLKKTEDDKKREDLRLHGYSNSDLNILKEVDSCYDDSKLISGLKMTKTGTFYAYSKLLSSDDINRIIDITDKNIDKAIDNISLGNFDINPKVTDKENLGCAFCEFKDICFKTNDDNVKIVKDKELSFLGGDINA